MTSILDDEEYIARRAKELAAERLKTLGLSEPVYPSRRKPGASTYTVVIDYDEPASNAPLTPVEAHQLFRSVVKRFDKIYTYDRHLTKEQLQRFVAAKFGASFKHHHPEVKPLGMNFHNFLMDHTGFCFDLTIIEGGGAQTHTENYLIQWK